MLSVVYNQCHVCWCSGDFRSQSINRNGTDPQSYNIPSPAWEELMYLDLIMANILQTWETWGTMSYQMAKAELCYILVPAECLEPNDARPSADIALTTMSDMRSFLLKFLCLYMILILISLYFCWSDNINQKDSWHEVDMEIFFMLLAFCEGNPSITWSFDIFFDVCLNKQLNKQWGCPWSDTPWCSCDMTVVRSFEALQTLTLLVQPDLGGSCQTLWGITSFGQRKHIQIIDAQRSFEKNVSDFAVITVPAEGPVPSGARPSAGTEMTELRSHI